MTKRIALAVALAASVAMLPGCAAVESVGKNVESSTVKLHRVVSLYDYDGELMRTWEGDMRIEGESSQQCSFILDGERTSINGGTIELLGAVDLDALLEVADECDEADVDGVTDWAARIRKAVGE